MRNAEYGNPTPNSEIMLMEIKAHASAFEKNGSEFRAFSDWVDLFTAAAAKNSTGNESHKAEWSTQIKRTQESMRISRETDRHYAESHTNTRDLLVIYNFHRNQEQKTFLPFDKLHSIQPQTAAKLQRVREELIQK